MKKNILVYLSLLASVSIYAADGPSSPASSNAKKTQLVQIDNSWVRKDLLNDEVSLNDVDRFLLIESIHGPFQGGFFPVDNSPGDTRYYGKVFPYLPAVQQPVLEEISERTQNGETLDVLEIGSGHGRMVWKLLLAGANVWANELSTEMMKDGGTFDQYIDNRIPKNLKKNLTKHVGSCFNLEKELSTKHGAFDYLYVQCVEHFMHPAEHARFMDLVRLFLKPGGKAVLTANSTKKSSENSDEFTFIQSQREKGVAYPGYSTMTLKMDFKEGISFPSIKRILGIKRPEDNTICTMIELNSFKYLGTPYLEPRPGKLVTQKGTSNFFDIETYAAAAEKAGLTLIRGFYTDVLGHVSNEYGVYDLVSVTVQK